MADKYELNISLDYIEVPLELQQCITSEQAWHYRIVPHSINGEAISFFIEDGKDEKTIINELEILFGKKITLVQIQQHILQKTLGKYFRRKEKKRSGKTEYLENYESEDFINLLIKEAKEISASDIHIEQYEDNARVRFRIDGKLIEKYNIKSTEYPSLVNKIKIKSNLDIAEKRLPQDGRIIFNTGHDKFDIRVSLLPTLHGEKIVMRLLTKDSAFLEIEELGFSEDQLGKYLEGIRKTNGIVLLSGPTGSGKTTTLYATLKILNTGEINITTIEDPIEYTLEGVNQVQVKENIGFTFSNALRTFLRQDPDIIMLGEIRDNETGQMAIRAALTGHLVLSTIHTNSAWGTISRLIDMGIPPYLLSSTLNLSIAQRLLRLLCPNCKREEKFDKNNLPQNYVTEVTADKHYTAVGCESCYYTGYKGRTAIYEIIPVTDVISQHIRNSNMNENQILAENKIRSLSDQAFELFYKGLTSADEIYPVLIKYNK